jgi:hypothetical protein
VAGIILGTREQDVDVEVDVIPRGDDPPEPKPIEPANRRIAEA